MSSWEDRSFPADDTSLGPLESNVRGDVGEQKIVWLRQGGGDGEGETSPADPLFGGEPPSPSDVLGTALLEITSLSARIILFADVRVVKKHRGRTNTKSSTANQRAVHNVHMLFSSVPQRASSTTATSSRRSPSSRRYRHRPQPVPIQCKQIP